MFNAMEFGNVPGWKGFDFALMRSETGKPVLVSNDVIRLYMSYVAAQRHQNEETLSFGDWIVAGDAQDSAGVPVVAC